MSLFQCYECGCRENTALCNFWSRMCDAEDSKWRGVPSKPWMLCSACDIRIREWHGEFSREFLPKGEFVTNVQGNLAHKDTAELCHEYLKRTKANGN